jgi:anti-sigma factor RsiW
MNMHEEYHPLLNAYLDGELHGNRLRQMQSHLAACADCQNELKELRRISDLLRGAPAPEFRPVERFVANLTLNLPRRTQTNRPTKPGSLLWWLVPAGLLGAWFFVRTAFALTDVVSMAGAAGLLGQVNAWLSGGGQQSTWFAAANLLSGGHMTGLGQSTLGLLNTLNVFGRNLFEGFLWQVAIVMLYWGWLAAWWLRRRSRNIEITASPVRS